MAFLEVPDKNNFAKIYYEIIGTGTPIVLIHGWLCSSEFWQEIYHISENGYKLIILDLRGHGKSSYARDLSIESLAEDINLLLETLNIEKAIIIGQSMGGLVAQSFYHKYPTKVIALGLWNTGSRIPFGHGLKTGFYVMRIIAFLFGLILAYPFDELFRSILSAGWKLAFYGKGKSPAYQKYISIVYANAPRLIVKSALSLSKFNGTKYLNEISVPTMILHGTQDRYIVIIQMAEQLHAHIPKSTMENIKDTAHFSLNEQPEEVSGRLINFLDNLD